MDRSTKEKSAMLVSPYDHGDSYDSVKGLCFSGGKRKEQFGEDYKIDWLDHIRTGAPVPFEKGVITYYRTFEERWQSDFYASKTEDITVSLGSGTRSFVYDPLDPPSFDAEGSQRESGNGRPDVITVYTSPFERDVFVKGRMRLKLTVSSDAPDTTFYVNVSIRKPNCEYLIRHDITSLCYQLGDYKENSVAELDFCFDEHAFLLKKGDSLRFDITSTDSGVYVPHTNQKGAYHIQACAQTATNKVFLDTSCAFLPIEISDQRSNGCFDNT
jgi:predicted acyl esterase